MRMSRGARQRIDRMTGYQQIASGPWATSLESFEGIPDEFEPRVAPEQRGVIGSRAHQAMEWIALVLPGTALALLLALLAYACSQRVHERISQITLAVVLGLIVRNTVGVPQAYEAGLRLCLRGVLRVGIVILGLTLSIVAVGHDALIGLPVMICTIATAMVAVSYINRALGLPRRLGTLIAVGTSICGVSAIVATAPIIEADENETSYAAACITIFGLVAMLCYPYVAHQLLATPKQSGVFFGTAIHDMSQATGAGLAYAQLYEHGGRVGFHTAVTVKLVRNLFMSLLIPLAGILYHRGAAAKRRVKQKWHQIVPLFVVGFLLMACLRSIGDAGDKAFGLIDHARWEAFGAVAKTLVPWILATSMAAVGLGTGLSKLKKLGIKPFSVGFAAALLVGVVSVILIKALGMWMVQ
jgi:uncharacterized integral membrane protein (TIGR00698 family)